MFNQMLLKSFLVASWILVVYAATPYAPDRTVPLAGVVLAMSYILCGIVYGVTDMDAISMVRKEKDSLVSVRDANQAMFMRLIDEHNKTMEDCKKATERVSRAISELRSLDSNLR